MGNGISTGSLLNQRVYNRNGGAGSSAKGGGVQKNSLTQTRITLANRNRGTSGRTSYTALSNAINGRKEVIYVGGGSNCCGTPSTNMSTMEKIAAWTAIAQQGVQLGQGIANLFGAGKADKTGGAKGPGGAHGTRGAGNPPEVKPQPKVNQDLSATAVTVLSGDNLISGMENATTSADLQAAIKDAESYLNGDLQTSRAQAKGLADAAKKKLDEFKENNTIENAEKEVKTAEQNVKNAENGVKSFEDKVAKEERNIQEAQGELSKASADYKTALGNTKTAQEGVKTAQGKVSTAAGQVSSLETQLASALPEQKAAIEAQLTQARADLATAKGELTQAEQNLTKAEQDEAKALNNVDNSKKGVADAKQKLADSKEKLEGAKKNLAAKQKELEANKELLQQKQDALKQLETEKANAEADVEKFEKLDQEYNSLESEITDQKARLLKMSQDEAKKMDKLDKKIEKAEENSNNAEIDMNLAGQAQTGHATTKGEIRAKKRMDKAETREANLRDQKAGIENSHVSVQDIQLGEQVTKALDACANLAHGGLGGMMSQQYINGHTVTSQNGQFFIDGSTTGVDRAEAEKLLKQ